MEVIRVMEGVYVLRDVGGCCANLVVGKERALLFDTCCGVEDLRGAVEEVTRLPLLVIASHGHFDHVGGSFQFDEVYLSEADFRILERYETKLLAGWQRDIAESAAKKGRKARLLRAGAGTAPPREWRCMRPLSFEAFDLGDRVCQVVPLPGHSAGSAGILIESLSLLLSGDALTPVMCMNFFSHMPPEVQLATLFRVKELGFSRYLTSHHDVLFGKSMVDRLIGCMERSRDGRFHRYQYPYPPYAKGAIYVDSLEGEPVALILEEGDCPPGALHRGRREKL